MSNALLIQNLVELYQNGGIHKLVSFNLNAGNVFAFNLTDSNESLTSVNILDRNEFFAWSDAQMKRWGTEIAIGLFNEDRNIYSRCELFGGDEPRTVHLGIDISAPHRTEVFAPLDGKIHSFADNSSKGDYGPTIILTHSSGEIEFFTLYGHLNRESLRGKRVGDKICKGQAFAHLQHLQNVSSVMPRVYDALILLWHYIFDFCLAFSLLSHRLWNCNACSSNHLACNAFQVCS